MIGLGVSIFMDIVISNYIIKTELQATCYILSAPTNYNRALWAQDTAVYKTLLIYKSCTEIWKYIDFCENRKIIRNSAFLPKLNFVQLADIDK